VQFAIDERFVYDMNDPDEASGKIQRHIVEGDSAHAALSLHAIATDARLLGMTERADGTLGGTAWRGEKLFRIHVQPTQSE
jgi:hypothetical protein